MGGRCTDEECALEQTSAVAHDDQDLLSDVVCSVLRRAGVDWQTRADDFWCQVSAADQSIGLQGWKLHVSATPLSAPHVLSRAAPVLVEAGCAFKFARSIGGVSKLVSTRFARGGAGKFITAYPEDADHLLPLAHALHIATCGLPGPSILSDRPYLPGSLVHYRYGAFRGIRVLTNDGEYEARLIAPDGSLVSDRRDAWFNPPSWAELPDASKQHRRPRAAPSSPGAVVLGARYVVRSTIQHANKGGLPGRRPCDRSRGRGQARCKHAHRRRRARRSAQRSGNAAAAQGHRSRIRGDTGAGRRPVPGRGAGGGNDAAPLGA